MAARSLAMMERSVGDGAVFAMVARSLALVERSVGDGAVCALLLLLLMNAVVGVMLLAMG